MALIKTINGKTPSIGAGSKLAENACVLGDVIMGKECSVWYHAVIRGDVNQIRIGNKTNIQDLAMIHGTNGKGDTVIGNEVIIGHRAILHGCQVEDHVLIGMGAILLDDCIVKTGSVVAAGSVVLENTIIESGSIYAGIPAKKVKSIPIGLTQEKLKEVAAWYIKYASWHWE